MTPWQILAALAGLYVAAQVATILIGSLVVWKKMGKLSKPSAAPSDARPEAADAPEPRDDIERELQELGWRYACDMDVSLDTASELKTRCYASPDGLALASVTDLKSGAFSETVLDITSRFADDAWLSLNNSGEAQVYAYPPGKFALQTPWKKSAKELAALHEAMVAAARESGFEPQPFDWASPAALSDDLVQELARCEAHLAKLGWQTLGADGLYRFKLSRAFRLVCRVWAHPKLKRFSRRPSDKKLVEDFRSGLIRFSAANKFGFGPR